MEFEFACQKQGSSRTLSIITLVPACGLGYLVRTLGGNGLLILLTFLVVIVAEAFAVAAIESRFLKYDCTVTAKDDELIIDTGKTTVTYPMKELTSIRTYPMENRRGTSEPRYWRMVIRAGEKKVTLDSVTMTLTSADGRRPAEQFPEDAETLRKVCGLKDED